MPYTYTHSKHENTICSPPNTETHAVPGEADPLEFNEGRRQFARVQHDIQHLNDSKGGIVR